MGTEIVCGDTGGVGGVSASWGVCAEVGVCLQRFGLLIAHQACITRRTVLPA